MIKNFLPPKIKYKLVAESLLCRDKLREAAVSNLQFPTWCPREESNPHYEIRNLASYPLNDKGGIDYSLKINLMYATSLGAGE